MARDRHGNIHNMIKQNDIIQGTIKAQGRDIQASLSWQDNQRKPPTSEY